MELMKYFDGGNREDIADTETGRETLPNLGEMTLLCSCIGHLLKKRRDLNDALRYLELSSKMCLENPAAIGDHSMYRISASLGELHLQMGNKGKAMSYFVEAICVLLRRTNPPAAAVA